MFGNEEEASDYLVFSMLVRKSCKVMIEILANKGKRRSVARSGQFVVPPSLEVSPVCSAPARRHCSHIYGWA